MVIDMAGSKEVTDGTLPFLLRMVGVKDADDYKLMTALREIAHIHTGDFRLTPNQNLVIANVTAPKKKKINEILDMYGIRDGKQYSGLRRNSIACVAMPTCGLAMAESERYLPSLIDKIEGLLAAEGLQDEEIVIRMSGCPNGCSRPALAEIAFIGKAPGKYNLYLGGSFIGDRLNQLYRENIDEEEILATLKEIFHDFAQNRTDKEHFGDFVVRKGYVDEVYDGQNFHRDMKGVL